MDGVDGAGGTGYDGRGSWRLHFRQSCLLAQTRVPDKGSRQEFQAGLRMFEPSVASVTGGSSAVQPRRWERRLLLTQKPDDVA